MKNNFHFGPYFSFNILVFQMIMIYTVPSPTILNIFHKRSDSIDMRFTSDLTKIQYNGLMFIQMMQKFEDAFYYMKTDL